MSNIQINIYLFWAFNEVQDHICTNSRVCLPTSSIRLCWHYQTRKKGNYTTIRSNTEKYNLQPGIQDKAIFSSFKQVLQNRMFNPKTKYLSQFRCKSSINHTGMRLWLSALKGHLYSYHKTEDPIWLQC